MFFIDIYHTTFDLPPNPEIQSRLEEVPGYKEDEMVEKLIEYHRHIDGVLDCYQKTVKSINADQPKADVFSQGKFVYLLGELCILPMWSPMLKGHLFLVLS